ncbi:SDR family oxidoreductase [Streptomyces sp. NPDC000405]|uniref:SDR family oxidoreductase n=1 Tax=Streptomyces sp. NPDC000405 TaxID=3161033 RepID=UPI00398D249F
MDTKHLMDTNGVGHPMSLELGQRVVMVTGAGSGIGRAAARLFVGLGARVVLVGRGAETLRETAEGLPASEVLVAPCDMPDEERVDTCVAEAPDRFGRLDGEPAVRLCHRPDHRRRRRHDRRFGRDPEVSGTRTGLRRAGPLRAACRRAGRWPRGNKVSGRRACAVSSSLVVHAPSVVTAVSVHAQKPLSARSASSICRMVTPCFLQVTSLTGVACRSG